MLEELQCRLVRPVEVIEGDHERRLAGDRFQVRRVGVEEAELGNLRVGDNLGLDEVRGLAQPREDAREFGCGAGGHERADERGEVIDVTGGVLVARLQPGPVRWRARGLVRAAPEHLCAAHLRVRLQFLRRACLADARLAHEQDQPASPGDRLVESLAQPFHLLFAPDEDAEGEAVEDVGVRVRRGLARGVDAFERGQHLGGAGGTLAGVLLQQPQDQLFEVEGAGGGVPRRCDGWRVDVLTDDGAGVVADERRPPRDQLVEHAAQRVEVRFRRRLAAQRLLRRHVGHRPNEHPVHRQARLLQRDGETEVADLGPAIGVQPDVPRLEVAMNDAVCVCVGEAAADVLGDLQCALGGQRQGKPIDGAARHVLADDVGLAGLCRARRRIVAAVVDGDDVWVVAEAAHRLRLTVDA